MSLFTPSLPRRFAPSLLSHPPITACTVSSFIHHPRLTLLVRHFPRPPRPFAGAVKRKNIAAKEVDRGVFRPDMGVTFLFDFVNFTLAIEVPSFAWLSSRMKISVFLEIACSMLLLHFSTPFPIPHNRL